MSDLRGQLQEIYDRHGRLTPAVVVEEARPEESPLHHELEWDDAVAGDEYRLIQAHRLIQRARIVYRTASNGERSTVRAFHAVRGPQGYAYEPAEKVAADPFMARLVLADMEREWRAFRRRYEKFEEFWQMIRGDLGEAA